MKYETTNKHDFGSGRKLIEHPKSEQWSLWGGQNEDTLYFIQDIHFDNLLRNGEIKEVQEKEFTKDDVIKFGVICKTSLSDSMTDNWNDFLNQIK